jgi:GTPase SAR1 family protein
MGGQDIFRASFSRAFYRGSSGVLMVYDTTCRESFNNIKDRWVENMRSNIDGTALPAFMLGTSFPTFRPKINIVVIFSCPCSAVPLVGTKVDLSESRAVTPDEGQALALELGASGWAEVSSLNGAGGKCFVFYFFFVLLKQ